MQHSIKPCLHAKQPLIEVRKTVFDDALALEITLGKESWEPNPNLDHCQVVGSFTSSVPIRAEQRSKLAYGCEW